jgi:hypothetical protein
MTVPLIMVVLAVGVAIFGFVAVLLLIASR